MGELLKLLATMVMLELRDLIRKKATNGSDAVRPAKKLPVRKG
jgi:hypothetical protein